MSFFRRLQLSRDRSVNVANLVDELLHRGGDREISFEDGQPWRLSQLHSEICTIDAFLRRTIALRPGQPVAIYRSNHRECFHWFLAIIRAGGIAVPLNPLLSLAEVRRIIDNSGIQVLVTDKTVFDNSIKDRSALNIRTWIQSDTDTTTLDGFLRATPTGDHFPPTLIAPSATIAVFHTSGTSGFPKGAALSSTALLGARASTVITSLFLGPNDLALIALPWSHIMAVSIALYGLMAGIRGCFMERFDLQRALDLIERHRITAFVGVPTMFTRLVNSAPNPAQLSTIRVWLSASDYLPTEVRQQLRNYGALLRLPFRRRIPAVLLNGYGMVELGGLAMMGIELSFLPGSGDLCFPMPPFHVRIADENGQPVPTGTTGECQIRRHGLAPHYWNDVAKKNLDNGPNNASATPDVALLTPDVALLTNDVALLTNDVALLTPDVALLTPDGWLRTGDLAIRNRLGLIRIVGRIKDVIKSGGYSIYVRELEETINAHPAVARAAAFGLPHNDKGEVPAAAVELREGSHTSETDLLEWCRENLAVYKAPRRIWVLDSGTLPQNHTGKVLRRTLRERYSNHSS